MAKEDDVTVEQQARELSEAILRAMADWSDARDYDGRVPLSGLMFVLLQCLDQFPADQRKGAAEDFAASLLRRVRFETH